MGQWEGQDVPLVRPSSCNVKRGIPSSRRYLPTYLPKWRIFKAFWDFQWAKTRHHGLKMGQNHLFEHHKWSRIIFGKTRF